jgi:uroporphyrinogen III methyltransferase/synthase
VTVYLVGAGPGDPGLLTRRGAELLARAEVVLHDRLVDPSLLALAPPGAEVVDVGKPPTGGGDRTGGAGGWGDGEARQERINDLLVAFGRTGRTVVRLKGGDPFLFGRGGEEAEALHAAGVAWEVVPGVTSALAAPAYAGIPVTHRGLSTSVTVVTGRVGDGTDGSVDWASLARAGGTLVVLMGVATRAEVAGALVAGGRPADTPVAVVEWGTTPRQRVARTTLGALAALDVHAPAAIVIGPVAALDLDWAAGRPLAGTTVVVTRAREQAGALSAALTAAGAAVLELAVIEVADPADGGAALRAAAARAADYDWVVFTSANGVRRFVAALRDGRTLGRARLAAVGKATAAALARVQLVADLVPDVATSASLGEELARALPGPGRGGAAGGAAGRRVLYPRAADARRTLPDALAAAGWEVDEVVAYRTVAAGAPSGGAAEAVGRADVVTFTSPSTVEAYLAMRTPSGDALPVPPVVACIGPVTAGAAHHAGLAVAVQSPDPSPEAFVAAIAAAVAAAGP